MVRLIGDLGLGFAGLGLIVFAVLYFGTVRWWTDNLGRSIAGVVGTIGLIMVLSLIRIFGLPLPGFFWWRAILFPILGIAVWGAVGAFVWAQFFAPRVKKRRDR